MNERWRSRGSSGVARCLRLRSGVAVNQSMNEPTNPSINVESNRIRCEPNEGAPHTNNEGLTHVEVANGGGVGGHSVFVPEHAHLRHELLHAVARRVGEGVARGTPPAAPSSRWLDAKSRALGDARQPRQSKQLPGLFVVRKDNERRKATGQ